MNDDAGSDQSHGDHLRPHVNSEAFDARLIRSGIYGLMINWAWKSGLAVVVLGVLTVLAGGLLRWALAFVSLVVLACALFQVLNLAWTRHELVHPERVTRPEVNAALGKTFLAAGNLEASAAAERFSARRA